VSIFAFFFSSICVTYQTSIGSKLSTHFTQVLESLLKFNLIRFSINGIKVISLCLNSTTINVIKKTNIDGIAAISHPIPGARPLKII